MKKEKVFETLKKVVTLALICVLVVGSFKVNEVQTKAAVTSTRTVTGRFNTGKKYTSTIHVFTYGKKAKLRICTFNQAGKRTNGKMYIEIKSEAGGDYSKKITGCNLSNNSTNVTLPAGNTHYIIRIKRNGTSNKNLTKCFYFSIDFKSNCYHF